MKKNIACEVGNFDTKLIARDSDIARLAEEKGFKKEGSGEITKLAVLNMVAFAHDRREFGEKKANLKNLLDVTIETPSIPTSRWFVGGLAFAEGRKKLKPTREDKKAESDLTIIQLLTTVALALYDPKSPVKEERINLGSLLPTEEYFNEQKNYIDMFTKKIVGKHKVKFHDTAFKDAEVTLVIDNVEILPEGTAGGMAILYDWEGQPTIKNYENLTIMNIDIGSIDTDISIMQNEEYLGNGFFGVKGGTTEVLRNIASDIQTTHKDKLDSHKLDPHKIDFHIRTKKPLYILGDQPIPLEELAKKHYDHAGWLLSNEITEEMKDRGIEKREVNIVNMFGGGTEFFQESFKKHFITGNVQLNVSKDPRFENAEGSLKSLLFNARKSDPEGEEVYAVGE